MVAVTCSNSYILFDLPFLCAYSSDFFCLPITVLFSHENLSLRTFKSLFPCHQCIKFCFFASKFRHCSLTRTIIVLIAFPVNVIIVVFLVVVFIVVSFDVMVAVVTPSPSLSFRMFPTLSSPF